MKTQTGVIIIMAVVLLIAGVHTGITQVKLTDSKDYADALILRHERKQVSLIVEYDKQLEIKDYSIKQLNLALDTAFKDNSVIQTLLNQDMSDWTPESVLGMRDKLASLPYGSWFESGHYVTAPWGSTLLAGTRWGASGHKGVDIKPNSGNNYEIIKSAIDGKVITWGRNDRLFGNYMVIESLDGQFQIKLAHLSSMAIFMEDGTYDLGEGMEFKAGQRIARMGNTGNSTGPHLHIEYYMLEEGNWRLLNASAILDYIGE